jgi:uncharacterized protein YbjT (DUF2867 family)
MILITGATGHVGREVVNLLLADGAKIVAISRNPSTARLPAEAQVTEGNPSHPQTISSALDGLEALLLSPRPVGGAAGELLKTARSKGVRHVVVLSPLTAQYGGGHRRFADEFRAFEDVAKQSGLEWTVLRSGRGIHGPSNLGAAGLSPAGRANSLVYFCEDRKTRPRPTSLLSRDHSPAEGADLPSAATKMFVNSRPALPSWSSAGL